MALSSRAGPSPPPRRGISWSTPVPMPSGRSYRAKRLCKTSDRWRPTRRAAVAMSRLAQRVIVSSRRARRRARRLGACGSTTARPHPRRSPRLRSPCAARPCRSSMAPTTTSSRATCCSCRRISTPVATPTSSRSRARPGRRSTSIRAASRRPISRLAAARVLRCPPPVMRSTARRCRSIRLAGRRRSPASRPMSMSPSAATTPRASGSTMRFPKSPELSVTASRLCRRSSPTARTTSRSTTPVQRRRERCRVACRFRPCRTMWPSSDPRSTTRPRRRRMTRIQTRWAGDIFGWVWPMWRASPRNWGNLVGNWR